MFFRKPRRLFPLLLFTLLGVLLPEVVGLPGQGWWHLGGGIIGFFFALVAGERLWDLVYTRIRKRVERMSPAETLATGMGLFGGGLLAFLVLSLLSTVAGIGPVWKVVTAFSTLFMTVSFFRLKEDAFGVYFEKKEATPASEAMSYPPYKVLDTSAIIDGRIADICRTGFLEGVLLVPSFVLAELQKIADSSDSLKRNRGRRGLEILNRMQKDGSVPVKIYDRDFEDLPDVDTKLVRLARMLGAKVITNDFNLNKVAELYGVAVLNINDLSNAIKPIVLPGEEIFVHLVKDGKEFGQGIGYLDDGTMVVVDGGRPHIGEDVEIVVTSVLQTSAGRMIFGKPKEQVRAIAQNQ